MKTQTLSQMTFSLLAVTTFLFTGCNTDANGVDSNSVVSPQVIQNKANTQNTNTPKEAKTSTPEAPQTPQTPSTETEEETVVSKVADDLKAEYLDAINAARAETQDCGSEGVFNSAPALTWNDRLGNAAWEHSNDMAQSDTFSHNGSGTATDVTAQDEGLGRGSRFSERIEHQGYTDYRTIGENIAAGYASAQEVVEGWLESDHHCANLMNPKFSEVGMALVEKAGSDYGTYWSQEFGGQ